MLSLIIGFVFGMIPFSYIIGRMKGIDLRKVGSGNIGATNLGRILGLYYFLTGFLLDGAKGFIPVILTNILFETGTLAGAGAILGHIFNPFFNFRGGKGVSTMFGAAIGLIPKSFLLSLIIWVIVYLTTYLVSLASIIFAAALPLVTIVLQDGKFIDRIFVIIVALFVIYAHRSNIRRLFKGEEPKTILWKKK